MKRECPSLFAALLVSLLVNVLLRSQTAYWPRAGLFSAAVCAPLLAGVGWLFARSWRLAADPVYKLLFGALLVYTSVLELLRLWQLADRLYPGAVTLTSVCLLVVLPVVYLRRVSALSQTAYAVLCLLVLATVAMLASVLPRLCIVNLQTAALTQGDFLAAVRDQLTLYPEYLLPALWPEQDKRGRHTLLRLAALALAFDVGMHLILELFYGAAMPLLAGLLVLFVFVTLLARSVLKMHQRENQSQARMLCQSEALRRLARLPHGGEDNSHFLMEITHSVQQVLAAARVSVWRAQGDEFRCVAASDPAAIGEVLDIHAHARYFGYLSESRTLAAADIAGDLRMANVLGSRQARQVVAALDAAIMIRDKLAGMLCIEDARGPREWEPDQIGFAAAVADQIVVAYESDERKRMESMLKPDTLIIGFARRFAPYKRATLIFADPDRLAKILNNPNRPVVLVFSGKAHPADEAGINLIQEVLRMCRDQRFLGRIFFIENYSLAVSRIMAQGCDVWLNTPRRPHEASGTSGMKLPVNGGINLSISDGWWCEGYNRQNGWTIGPVVSTELPSSEQNDYADAEALYSLLENAVVPLYFERNEADLPQEWINTSKRSLKSLTAMYSSNRMLTDYIRQFYLRAAQRRNMLRENKWEACRTLANWQNSLPSRFCTLKVDELAISGIEGNTMTCGEPVSVQLRMHLGEMQAEEILVQLVIGRALPNGSFREKPEILRLEPRSGAKDQNDMRYVASYIPSFSGHYRYGVRIMPVHPAQASPLETDLILWA